MEHPPQFPIADSPARPLAVEMDRPSTSPAPAANAPPSRPSLRLQNPANILPPAARPTSSSAASASGSRPASTLEGGVALDSATTPASTTTPTPPPTIETTSPSPADPTPTNPSSRTFPPLFHHPKPYNPRRATEPVVVVPSSPSSPSPSPSASTAAWITAAAMQLPYRPRTTSPLSGSHTRSRSAAGFSTTSAPSMSRTQSMPGVNGAGHILYAPIRPQSPSGSPSRVRQHRKPLDESFPPTSPVRMTVLEREERRTIIERNSSPNLATPTQQTTIVASSISRHRRPSSPLRHLAHASTGSLPSTNTNFSTNGAPSTPSSIASSPSYRAYDTFSSSYGMALSSVPSTPTSARSRSPSISSLETIPDSPDAEEAAMEAERLARLQAVVEEDEEEEEANASDSSDSNSRGRSSLDVPARGRTLGFGSSRDKRKRWSVCGAERRGDIDLETIWED